MSGCPKSCSIRTAKTNAGSPKGRESYGDGVPVLVVGVTSHQGVRESRTQGEEAQVVSDVQTSAVRVMRMAIVMLDIIRELSGYDHWRAV
jgi:hypothetical protein